MKLHPIITKPKERNETKRVIILPHLSDPFYKQDTGNANAH